MVQVIELCEPIAAAKIAERDNVLRDLTRRGLRVLAMGYKVRVCCFGLPLLFLFLFLFLFFPSLV